MAKIYGALEVAQLEWFTDAGKPAASQYAYRVIYLSDLKVVVVSDGTAWNPVNSRFTSSVDSSATGASAAIANGTNGLIAVTNTSLSSIGSLSAPANGLICVVVNETGNSIQVLDEDLTTGTAVNRIRTGTGAPITIANNSSVYFVYVANDSRWHVVGGVGSGTGAGINFITNGTAEADATGWATYAESDAVTFQDTGDTVTLNSHGLINGNVVSFTAIVSTTGIVVNTSYFVISATTNTFQLSSTLNGAALPLTTNGSGTMVRSLPKVGTGGTPAVTWTRSTSAPLVGIASFVFTKGAVNRQGQGVSFDFTIDSAYRSKVLQISFEYAVAAGTFAAGTASADSDITVWIYDKTNAVMIQPVTYKLFANGALSTTFNSYFQANPNSTSYRLILHSATSSALAYDLKVDMVSVNPQIVTTGNVRGPVGSIIATGSLTPPMGYLYADGSAVSRTDYAFLFQAIGTTFGAGNGTTTFNIPDLRGIFARGAGTQTFGSITYSATLGTKQNDDFKSHFHPTNVGASTGSNWFYNAGATTLTGAVANGSTAVGGTETRPANLAVAYHVCFDSGSVQMSDSIDYDRAEIGTVHAYAGLTAPTGFLLCDGSAVSRSLYSDLYAVIGNTYGAGDGSTTFNLPDTRGIFLRGAGTNPSNSANTTTIGTRQLDDFKSHTHRTLRGSGTGTGNQLSNTVNAATTDDSNYSFITTATGGTETRPANVGVNYIIRHAKRVVPSAIAATETIAASYSTTSTGAMASGSRATVIYPTRIYDTHNAYNTTTGAYTFPVSGKYLVTHTVTAAATSNTQALLADIYRISTSTAYNTGQQARLAAVVSNLAVTQSIIVNANAGETMDFRVGVSSVTGNFNGNAPENNFSIARIGN